MDRKPRDFTGMIVLAALLGLIALGLYVFPKLKSVVHTQDCIASGRTDCENGSGG